MSVSRGSRSNAGEVEAESDCDGFKPLRWKWEWEWAWEFGYALRNLPSGKEGEK